VSSRQYSSFLLRFWLISNTGTGTTSNSPDSSLVLQLQHLQTGTTWRLNSLEELSLLLGNAIEESEGLLPGGTPRGKSLRPVTRLDTEIE
jgi:hypothetical protein